MYNVGDLLQDIEDGSLALVLEIRHSELYAAPVSYKLLFESGVTIWLASGIIYYYFDRVSNL